MSDSSESDGKQEPCNKNKANNKKSNKDTPASKTISTLKPQAAEDDMLSEAEITTTLKPCKGAARHLHQKEFEGCPTINCVANHLAFQGSDSLAWTFLTLTDPIHDEASKLLSGMITCAWCDQSWPNRDCQASCGSTGDFMHHFKKSHSSQWGKASKIDQDIIQPDCKPGEDGQVNLDSWAKVCSAPQFEHIVPNY
jgi:hypothetical protein